MQSIPSLIKEILKWAFVAPLYAAGIAFSLILLLSFPLMIELLFDQRSDTGGATNLFEAVYIWFGFGAIAGGYAFFLVVAPATLVGTAKIVIEQVVETPKYQSWLVYGVAVPVSTLAWFYYLFVFPSDFSITGSH